MSAWKQAERDIAAFLGGTRVPITGRARGSAPDIEHKWLAIEVKRDKHFPKWMENGHAQAIVSAIVEQNRTGVEKLPVLILRPPRAPVRRCYVIMSLGDFWDWFGGGVGE